MKLFRRERWRLVMGVVFLKYQNNIDSAHWSISTFVWQLGLYNPSSACTKELNEAGFKWFAMIDFKLLTRAVLFRKCLKLMLSFSVSFGCWVTVFHNFHQSIGVEHLLFLRNFLSLEFSKYMKKSSNLTCKKGPLKNLSFTKGKIAILLPCLNY